MNDKLKIKLIGFGISFIFVSAIGFMVFSELANSRYKLDITQEEIDLAKEAYCAKIGMEAIDYIAQSCSIFGCGNYNSVKCVNDGEERLIDYDDEIFCKLKIADDYGMCER
jgi:hypothetical protein